MVSSVVEHGLRWSLHPQCLMTLFASWLRQTSTSFPHLQRHLYTSGRGEEMIVSRPNFLSESDTGQVSQYYPGVLWQDLKGRMG